ncbi:putative katanin [Trypanosoma grayi]|uniref:putative katanin n=1 Tax=Trypanosoma grayi TaxID=71804 RepID=UPI0004F44ED0|nr:putative katanin [Trypanosoma grayi]KEG10832.1 putative katanin [Trypanosoma grayi]
MITTSALQLPCQVYCSRFSPNRAQQLVGLGGKDGAIYVYPFGDYPRIARLESEPSPLTALAFDPQQRRVVGGNDNGSVRLWDVGTEKFIRSFGNGHKSTVTGVDYHRYTDFIATCSRDKSLRIWDTRKKTCLQSYKGATSPLCATEFSPNGRWAASGCAEGVVRLYDLVSGKELNEFRAHTGAVTSIQFHPEQYYMAVGSSDGSVSLWELENFTKVYQSSPLDTPIDAVHLFGKKMLVAADHVLRVYDFTLMSDSTACSIESPWNIIGDLSFSSVTDEALFVEFSGATARMGRLSLSQCSDASPQLPPSPPTTPTVVTATAMAAPPFLRSAPEEKNTKATGSLPIQILHPNPQKVPLVRDSVTPLAGSSNSLTTDLLKSSASMLSVLQRRLTHIRVVRSLWVRDPQQALEYLEQLCADQSECGVVADFLVAMQNMRMKERINVSNLPGLLNVLGYALKSEQESLLLAALKVVRSMNSRFRAKMDEARRFAASFKNVDAKTPETIMQQYYELSARFENLAVLVYELQGRKGQVGEEACEVLDELPAVTRVR